MKVFALSLICLTVLITASVSYSEEIANVNGVSLSADDYKRNLAQLSPQMKMQLNNPEQRRRFLDMMIQRELLAQEAVKEGIDKQQQFLDEMELTKKMILVNLMADKISTQKITDEAMKEYYKKNAKNFQLIHISQILLSSEADAIKIKKELSAGGDFADLARKHSVDTRTNQGGGDLGYLNKNQLMPQIYQVVSKLKANEMAGPVQSQMGYHLIKVHDFKSPKYEEMTQENKQAIRTAILIEEIDKLKKSAKVSINEDAFKRTQ